MKRCPATSLDDRRYDISAQLATKAYCNARIARLRNAVVVVIAIPPHMQSRAGASAHRPIYWLHCENEDVLLRVLKDGRTTETHLAKKDGHGRWLEWLQSS